MGRASMQGAGGRTGRLRAVSEMLSTIGLTSIPAGYCTIRARLSELPFS